METVKDAVGREIPKGYIDWYGVFEGQYTHKDEYRRVAGKVVPTPSGETKLVSSLREVTEKSGLKDGMMISFHHHFRKGDYVLNMVMREIAETGTKNLRLAASPITSMYESLIKRIKSGVIAEVTGSDLCDKVGSAIFHSLIEKPVVIRSHGGRTRIVEPGEIYVGVAFFGASSVDPYGNVNGSQSNVTCDSLGYAKVDAEYADKVIITTDYLVDYPNTPTSISRTLVDYVVVVDAIGDSDGVAKDATRSTSDPRELLTVEDVYKVITASPYFKDGTSFQSGSGGSTLAVTRFLTEEVRESDITTGYLLGGITNSMVELLEEGLAKRTLDTRTFDRGTAASIACSENHCEISASFYTNPGNKDAAMNQLDIVTLSALEADTDFNMNIMVGPDGVIHGVSGGHSDTATDARLSLILHPLLRGHISTIAKQVNTATTPSEGIDVVVTEVGIAVNPRKKDLQEILKNAGMNLFTMEELKDKAYALAGIPDPIERGNKVVALIEYRGGSLIDVIGQVRR